MSQPKAHAVLTNFRDRQAGFKDLRMQRDSQAFDARTPVYRCDAPSVWLQRHAKTFVPAACGRGNIDFSLEVGKAHKT